jgi:hypothetical protein
MPWATGSGSATAVLIGTSAREDPAAGVFSRKGVDGRASGNLTGTVADIANMYRICVTKLGVAVQKMFNDTDPLTTSRENVLTAIRKALNSGKDHVLIYYSGHGRSGDGAWCFETNECGTEFITPSDMHNLIQEAHHANGFKKHVVIVSDSCHSGCWVHAECFREQSSGRNPFVIIQAACGPDEYSVDTESGGLFTKQWANYCRKGTDIPDITGDGLVRNRNLLTGILVNAYAEASYASFRATDLFSTPSFTPMSNSGLMTQVLYRPNKRSHIRAEWWYPFCPLPGTCVIRMGGGYVPAVCSWGDFGSVHALNPVA